MRMQLQLQWGRAWFRGGAAIWLGGVMLMTAMAAHAMDSDRQQIATLQADDFVLEVASGVRTYRGNVVFRQGSLHLRCAELITRTDAQHELQQGKCVGAPSQFTQRPQRAEAEVNGWARTITLDLARNVVTFEGDAKIAQVPHQIHGQRIIYDLQTEQVTVTSAQVGGSPAARPRLLVQPRTNHSPPPN